MRGGKICHGGLWLLVPLLSVNTGMGVQCWCSHGRWGAGQWVLEEWLGPHMLARGDPGSSLAVEPAAA